VAAVGIQTLYQLAFFKRKNKKGSVFKTDLFFKAIVCPGERDAQSGELEI